MARRRVVRKRFPCGHRGLGTHCHRCAFARVLETLYVGGGPKGDRWASALRERFDPEDAKTEAARLRGAA
jgi:hypothetical protein